GEVAVLAAARDGHSDPHLVAGREHKRLRVWAGLQSADALAADVRLAGGGQLARVPYGRPHADDRSVRVVQVDVVRNTLFAEGERAIRPRDAIPVNRPAVGLGKRGDAVDDVGGGRDGGVLDICHGLLQADGGDLAGAIA